MNRDTVPKWLWCTAEEVVEASMRGLAKGSVIVIPRFRYRAIVALLRHIPKFVLYGRIMSYARRTGRT